MILDRTKNAARNMFWGFTQKILILLLSFISRTVFIKFIGVEYLGLSTLCGSILNILNIAELGFGTAIVFSMYKPVAEDDNETLCALLNLYRKIYHAVGTVVLVTGLIVLPFLHNFIKGEVPADVNIYIVYCIFLANSVLGYFLYAYTQSLFYAHQRDDINFKRTTFIQSLCYIINILLMVFFRNYYTVVILVPLTTIANNLYNAYYAKKMYPQIVCRGDVSQKAKIEILKKIAGLLSIHILNSALPSFNGIFISSFVGLTMLAIYNNYSVVTTTIVGFLYIVVGSMLAGIGNRMNTDTKEQNLLDFRRLAFGYSWIVGVCSVSMICLYQHFIQIWLGKELLFPVLTMLLFVIFFYVSRIIWIVYTYRGAAGLWWEDRFRPMIMVLTHLILAPILGKIWGINGLLLSLILCFSLIDIPWSIWIIFKYYFKASPKGYYLDICKYTTRTVIVSAITYFICYSLHQDDGMPFFIIKILICAIVPNLLFVLFYFKKPEFRYSVKFLWNYGMGYYKKLTKKA